MDDARDMPQALPVNPGLARWRAYLARHGLAGACVIILALSFALDPEHPTRGVQICPMKALTALPCPGCGITRSLCWMSRGNLAKSFHHHPLGPAAWLAAVLGASALVWPGRLREAVRSWGRRHSRGLHRVIYALTAGLLVFDAARILFIYIGPPAWWPW